MGSWETKDASFSYKSFKTDLTWTKYEQFILHILFLNTDVFPTLAYLQVDIGGENLFCIYPVMLLLLPPLTDRSTDMIPKPAIYLFIFFFYNE